MAELINLLIWIVVIYSIVKKVKPGKKNTAKRTTYINGNPVKTEKRKTANVTYGTGWNVQKKTAYQKQTTSTYRSNTGSYRTENSTYRSAGSYDQTMRDLRDKVTKNIEKMRADAAAGTQKYRTQPHHERTAYQGQSAAYGTDFYRTNTGYQNVNRADKDDILSRAKNNVQDNDRDLLKEIDSSQHEAARNAADQPVKSVSQSVSMEKGKPQGQQIGMEWDKDCSILGTVEDLMIKGYSGDLSFDRDFISEGIDMINRYQELGSNL